jgi:hypothetical protein
MKGKNNIQSFGEFKENLNISDVRSSKSNGKVTKIGQKFKVKLPTQIMRDSKFWEEDKIYTCDNIVEFEGLDNEIYVGDNWISDSFTVVV